MQALCQRLVMSAAALVFTGGTAWAQQPGDLDTLLNGVTMVGWTGGAIPGSLAVYGTEAFPVILGGSTDDTREAVVAAARDGAGRLVVLGHDGFLASSDFWDIPGTNNLQLHHNIVAWLAPDKPEPRLGVIGGLGDLAARLGAIGYDAEETTTAALSDYDVIYAVPWPDYTAEDVQALGTFVESGGGLVLAMTGWGWAQLNPSEDLAEDFPGNHIVNPAGLAWTDVFLSRTSDIGFTATNPPSALTHAQHAFDAALAGDLPPLEATQAAVTLGIAVRSVPLDDTLLLPRVEDAIQDPDLHTVPTPEAPITLTNPIGRMAVVYEFRVIERLPPDQRTFAHPAAQFFPGEVGEDAERTTKQVWIDTARPRWQSTGLYAPPGERIIVQISHRAAGQGFHLRIGAHTDQLWHLPSWQRFPEISFSTPLDTPLIHVANPFGGLIYVDVPADTSVADFPTRIRGAVQSPRFIQGVTKVNVWNDSLRYRPAPWGEIESDKLILTLPALQLQQVSDPDQVVDVWDEVLDSQADLAQRPRARASAERFVVDEQISAGFMHAGYPIMGPLSVQGQLVDVDYLRTTDSSRDDFVDPRWGFFHEIGHNHQSSHWTFDGTGEVTVNLFTLYTFETVVGIPVSENPRGSLMFRQEQMAQYDFSDPDRFTLWKSDPFIALVFYEQLQQAFGWETYKALFFEYRETPEDELPVNDGEKRDQWLVRFSQQVGWNLGPFFEAWGIPASGAARDAVANLPCWEPDASEQFPVDVCPLPDR
ncbi:MAG: hypothetical protein GEU99_20025 [Luteitalea sp.]|nr:hypothetical protein [Luteitalea sp.]